MDEADSIEARLALEVIKQMVRDGALDPATIVRVRENAEHERDHELSHAAHVLFLESLSQTASEFEADYRRRQMVERTARIGRDPNA